jgi:hypothetical protein
MKQILPLNTTKDDSKSARLFRNGSKPELLQIILVRLGEGRPPQITLQQPLRWLSFRRSGRQPQMRKHLFYLAWLNHTSH